MLGAFAVFMVVWFRVYLTSNPIAATDLPGHVTAIDGYRDNWNWWRLSASFYDVSCFTGYPAFQFYAFLAHLVAAALAVPLSLFSSSASRLATHLMLVAAMATLPVSMMGAADPLVREIWGDQPDGYAKCKWIFALVTCLFAFWFINHDYQWYGIGSGAVLNIGLFSQAFAWHFMLLHLGALLVFLREGGNRNQRRVSLWFVLLLLTHTMTAVFSAFIALLTSLWFNEQRWALVKAHVMAFALAGFWVVPMVAFMGAHTGLDIITPSGNFLEIFLRYPLYALIRSINSWVHGVFEPLSPVELMVMGLMVLLVVSKQTKRCRMLTAFWAFGAVALVFLTSGFIASSVRVGFHWYRFVAYTFLYLTLLLCPLPFLLLRRTEAFRRHTRWPALARLVVAAVFAGSFVATACLPHNERAKIRKSATPDYLANENAVLDYFRGLPDKGRVLTEYFNNYDKFPFSSCHVISTRLLHETGFEPINGLFVQASLAYHMPMGSANQLKANSYNGPLLYPAVSDLTDDAKFEQLKDFGITHVIGIAGSEFTNAIKKRALGAPKEIGNYVIMQILPEPTPMATTVTKRVAVYMDLKGTLPYKFVELYFYARQKLAPSWEVLEIKKGDDLPPNTEAVIINGSPSAVRNESTRQLRGIPIVPTVIGFEYAQLYVTKHYSVQYQQNHELDDFTDATSFLAKKVGLEDKVSTLAEVLPREAREVAQMVWSPDRQSFTLDGLHPGRLYRINYSAFPYWRSGDGRTWRGSEERIFFVPRSSPVGAHNGFPPQATTRVGFAWAPYKTGSFWVGWLMTLAAAYWCWRHRRADRTNPAGVSG